MPVFEPLKDPFATFAEELGRLLHGRHWFPIKECLDPGKALMRCWRQPAIDPDAAEAFGQDVLKETPNELATREPQKLLLTGLAIGVAKRHLMAVVSHDGMLADGGATDITREILHDVCAGPDWLAVGVPRLAPDAAWDGLVESRILRLERGLQEDTRLDGETFDREKEVGILGADPRALWSEATLRDDVVNVRVVFELPRPCVEDTEESEGPTEVLGFSREFLQSLRAALEKEFVTERLVRTERASKGGWNGKRDKVVGNVRDQLGFPFLRPVESGLMTAERAIAVIARMVGKVVLGAVLATVQSTAKRRRAASEDSLGGTTMLWRDAGTKVRVVSAPVPSKDFFEVEAQAVMLVV